MTEKIHINSNEISNQVNNSKKMENNTSNFIDPDKLQKGETKPEFILASTAKKLGIYTGKAYFECPHCLRERGKKGKVRYSPYVLKEDFRNYRAGEIVDFEKYGRCFSTSCSHYEGVYPSSENGFRYSWLGFPISTNNQSKSTSKGLNKKAFQKNNLPKHLDKVSIHSDKVAEYFKEQTDYDTIDEDWLKKPIFIPEDEEDKKNGVVNKKYGVRVWINEQIGLDHSLMKWALSKGYQRDKIEKACEELGIQGGPIKRIEKDGKIIYSKSSLCLLTDLNDRIIDGRIHYLDPETNKRFRNENFPNLDFPIEYFFHDDYLHCYTPQYLNHKQDSTWQDYRTSNSLFGLHRLRKMIWEKGPDNVKVGLQEGLKQTLCATMDLPQYAFLSTISESGLKIDNIALLQRLRIKSVCIIPDKGFESLWTKKAGDIMQRLNNPTRLEREHLDRIHLFVSSVLQSVKCLKSGEDTADL